MLNGLPFFFLLLCISDFLVDSLLFLSDLNEVMSTLARVQSLFSLITQSGTNATIFLIPNLHLLKYCWRKKHYCFDFLFLITRVVYKVLILIKKEKCGWSFFLWQHSATTYIRLSSLRFLVLWEQALSFHNKNALSFLLRLKTFWTIHVYHSFTLQPLLLKETELYHVDYVFLSRVLNCVHWSSG